MSISGSCMTIDEEVGNIKLKFEQYGTIKLLMPRKCKSTKNTHHKGEK